MNASIRFSVAIVCIVTFFVASCKEYYHKNNSHLTTSDNSIKVGKQLATLYCASCHQLPDPSLLDTKTWDSGVLPAMGERLGIKYRGFKQYPITEKDVSGSNTPGASQQVINVDQWQSIIDYYVATSPDSLPSQKREHTIVTGLPLFKVETPVVNYPAPATCYVKINSKDSLHPLITSDVTKQNIYFFTKDLQARDSVLYTGAVTDIDFNNNKILACDIGVFNPNNGRAGRGEFLSKDVSGTYHVDTAGSMNYLQRPVQITSADLNKDGKMDYLVCEFGYLTGNLSWLENTDGKKYVRHVLRPVAGAIKAYINDYNHDGLPDIWVLFAQGEEGIFLFTNKGNGNFDQKEVLRFPPSYGSSYFEFADFNKDGYPDILYTCGDNADYSPVLKPYHGVYIFMNDKTNHFEQKFFFPINGCYKAIARDFDNDGYLDIATISFFADYAHQPEEGFVYLKNTGNLTFLPYTMQESKLGRWLVMDAGDIDGDGKIDIVLGNFPLKRR